MDQLMAGSWTLLPLGWRVVSRINRIIREEMESIGAQEILMPLLHPKEIWNETGRWDKAKEVMYQFEDTRGKEFALSFTHEEILLDLARKHLITYKDLPLALYHFSTKFRNEPRARSGILRGREFIMKDLYSLHADEKDFWNFYERVKEAYAKILTRIGFQFLVTEAPGGVFTENVTHEFQVPAESGEDTIYYCKECGWGENYEIFEKNKERKKSLSKCPKCKKGEVRKTRSIEVGNIFPFGRYYSKMMEITFTDAQGDKQYPYFGSYGIGTTRVMGAWVEVSHDERGIIWSKSISPYDVHLIEVGDKSLDMRNRVKSVYQKLVQSGVEVLWDERDAAAGEKFADADLIGIPVRLVISRKTGDKIEWKKRDSNKIELFELGQVIDRFNNLK